MIHNPLKPCPFCGSTDVENDHTGPWWVTCQTCGCDGPTAPTEAESAEAWNAALRHEPPADPTPLPAPALGMRAWREIHDANGLVRSPRPYDITELRPDETWLSFFDDTSEIGAITDFRTGEVLWRRQ